MSLKKRGVKKSYRCSNKTYKKKRSAKTAGRKIRKK